jgi:hypothetical protein
MPLDDRSGTPSRHRRAGRPPVPSAPEESTVAVLLRAGRALVVVMAALAGYVLGLAAASAEAAWNRRAGIAAQVDRAPDEPVTARR